MPKEAFADMWSTIKAGNPWTGLVKNRTKSGDFYWVLANVTPVIESGKTVGFMSVRTQPSRDQVRTTETIYREIRNSNPRHLQIRQGEIIAPSAFRTIKQKLQLSLQAHLLVSTFFSIFTSLLLVADQAKSIAALLPVWFIDVAAGISVALLVTFFFRMSKTLHRLSQITQQVQALAGGDLTVAIETNGNNEIGILSRSVRQLKINLFSIVGDIRNNFEKISQASSEIAHGNMELSGRTESQASSLEETASSMEEIASTVEQNSSNAREANSFAATASEQANVGGSIVHKLVGTMGDINSSSNKIVDIISIIDGIAFQTNILALNAAVEAARAGEQGRGFAVVASEVRTLAQRSASAAKEITQLIQFTVNQVNHGAKFADQAGGAMKDIIGSVQKVATIMGEISFASNEQSDGIAQINDAIMQMDNVTQQNAAMVEEAASAASSLSEQTRILTEALAIFKLGDNRAAKINSQAFSRASTTGRSMEHMHANSKPALMIT